MGHGGGGRLTDEFLDTVVFKHLERPRSLLDGAEMDLTPGRYAFTTDSHVITPIIFPGGDVGKLAVCGTCNDLAMMGAPPEMMSFSLILEEGFELAKLEQVLANAAATAREAGVSIVTGDTKVVSRGQADGVYINTSGIGKIFPEARLGFDRIEHGDRILVSGGIGEHGLAVLACRKGLEFRAGFESDVACVAGLANALVRELGPTVKFLRDPTRGGLAGVLADIAENSRADVWAKEADIPVLPAVHAASEVLGIDVLHVANEGKFVAVVAGDLADRALAICRSHPLGRSARIIGDIRPSQEKGKVILETIIGGKRIVHKPYGEQLPRIC